MRESLETKRNSIMPPKSINIALQGGGSHGAFTWGVLDRLLEEKQITFEAVTGASAGAMNAVVLADGLAHGCSAYAREKLRAFWQAVAALARTSPLQRAPMDVWRGVWNLDNSPAFLWFDMLSRLASPYDLNPFDYNPLKDLLKAHVDFDRVRTSPLQVFISATKVETGRPKVFERSTLTPEHVMASACLPHLYQAVEIDGVPYWDGGYMGNPPLWPLFDHSQSDDVLIVQINPITRTGVPKSARDILNRMNEITFNTSLLHELRSIDFVGRLIDAGRMQGTGYRRVFVHMISDEALMSSLGASSKLNAETSFLTLLFESGRKAASGWLEAHLSALGNRSSIDLRALFQGDEDPLDGSRLTRAEAYKSKQQPKSDKV
jgi:NTE family protein